MTVPAPPPRLRLGMVGGGRGAFIGEAHRTAARIDDRYDFVAGALSLDSYKAIESGRDLRLDPMRCYTDYRGMAQAEATRPDGIQVVSVVTPNVSHHPICKTFLEAGIDVICDKPLTTTLAEAKDLRETVRRTGRFLGVAYNYSAYPLMREARALIEAGVLGAVRVVQVEFALGWLSVEDDGKQARWRTDPAQSGPSFVTADLGTHCFHLAEFVTQRRVSALSADLATMVPGRRLEDNAQIGLRFDNGARGALWVSMVAAGEQVGLRIRVYGERGHIAWDQSEPDRMRLALQGEAARTILRGGGGLSLAAKRATRLVAGLPEGYYEAFATLYRDYADILTARRAGVAPDPLALWAPTVEDGVRGMAFVEAALRSQAGGGAWTVLDAVA
jgi:predicted dehydrogenase